MNQLIPAYLLVVTVAVSGIPDAPVFGTPPKFPTFKLAAAPKVFNIPVSKDAPVFGTPPKLPNFKIPTVPKVFNIPVFKDAHILGTPSKVPNFKIPATPKVFNIPVFKDVPKFVTPRFGASKVVVGLVQKDVTRDVAGQFSLRYVSEDGTTVSEVGKLVPNAQGDDSVLVKEGSYTFTSPEGQRFTVNYVADQNGYRATGDHI